MKKLLSALLALCLTLSLTALPASALELEEAKELLAVHYVEGVAPEVLELDSLDAILEAIGDPYTFYMTAEQYEAFNRSVNGQTVVGIGATVETAFNGGYRIMSVLPNSPALEAGILPGDILTAVNGEPMSAAVDPRVPIVGEEGTELTLTLNRNGQTMEVTLTRKAVSIPIVTYESRDSAGYIDCISFGETTAGLVEEAVESMDSSTAVWIMDLRSNPGGGSSATAATSSFFTGGGIMLYFRDGSGRYNYSYTMPTYPDLTDKPVIVLTSENSASGSELFAGDIRSYGAGIALGQRTFGKGTAQVVFDENNCPYMENGEAMKITTYRFFAPDGTTNHVVGVLPTLLISPENTERAAMLLTQPKPSRADGFYKLELAGQTFYISAAQAAAQDNRAAFTELLEALPSTAALSKGIGSATWNILAPEQAAEELNLSFTPRAFADSADSPYGREIDLLGTYRIVGGYQDGGFHPADGVTRAQFCAMVASALNLPAGKGGRFSDVPDGAWYAGAVNAMADMGFVSGSGGQFAPDAQVSFQDMTAILARVAVWACMDSYDLDQQILTLEERETYSAYAAWAQKAARCLDELGVLLEDVSPADAGSRETAAAMLCRLMENTELIWD